MSKGRKCFYLQRVSYCRSFENESYSISIRHKNECPWICPKTDRKKVQGILSPCDRTNAVPSDEEILDLYVVRWAIEVYFRDCKTKLAIDKYQIRFCRFLVQFSQKACKNLQTIWLDKVEEVWYNNKAVARERKSRKVGVKRRAGVLFDSQKVHLTKG